MKIDYGNYLLYKEKTLKNQKYWDLERKGIPIVVMTFKEWREEIKNNNNKNKESKR